jgi:hypothetical protein
LALADRNDPDRALQENHVISDDLVASSSGLGKAAKPLVLQRFLSE